MSGSIDLLITIFILFVIVWFVLYKKVAPAPPLAGRVDADRLPIVVQPGSPAVDGGRTRPGRCVQCGGRRGWPSLHVTFCSACGRGQARLPRAIVDTDDGHLRSQRVRRGHRYVLVAHDELPALWVRLPPWQRTVRQRTLGDRHRPAEP